VQLIVTRHRGPKRRADSFAQPAQVLSTERSHSRELARRSAERGDRLVHPTLKFERISFAGLFEAKLSRNPVSDRAAAQQVQRSGLFGAGPFQSASALHHNDV
jgi:hypothetical protein